ncbi:hypothetical protein [Micromonospora haikouensis]|uniref:Uncharacterized protein n=1 Tax=Micromonospora haikouensis TaxID=686309 RepID=A0A0D0X1E1_9ACTN|nr:hypothetical protein [Micromonospora haikouensis]KIR64729.1 hypothetical protein TK50_03670 [Micromonospora haikouensis]
MTATRRKLDFRPRTVVTCWPEAEWYTPETFEEVAAQDAVRSAVKQGLPPVIQDRSTLDKIAALGKR